MEYGVVDLAANASLADVMMTCPELTLLAQGLPLNASLYADESNRTDGWYVRVATDETDLLSRALGDNDPATQAVGREEMRRLKYYSYGVALPAICFLGIVGNVLNLIVLTRPSMKGPAYVYMRGTYLSIHRHYPNQFQVIVIFQLQVSLQVSLCPVPFVKPLAALVP